MIHKKVMASIVLSLIVVIVLVVTGYLIRQSRTDVVTGLLIEGRTIPVVFSFEYETTEENEPIDRVISVVLLLNPNTKKIGMLEIPGYTGVYDNSKKIVQPIDKIYRLRGYKDYFEELNATLELDALQYIFIRKENVSSFIDLLGGLEVFIISEEFSANDDAVANFGAGIGDVPFDGEGVSKYVSNMENDTKDELQKSVKRKELFTAIVKQFSIQHAYYENADTVFSAFKKYMDTSMTKDTLKTLWYIFADYQVNNIYFQRLNGQIRNINLDSTLTRNTRVESNSDTSLLFIDTGVGSLSNVVKSMEEKLVQEQTDRVHEKITISIFNGTVVNGLAGKTKEIYEKAGFEVSYIGNANSSDVNTTTIIDRVGNKIDTRFAAQIIGVRSIITDITSVDSAGANITLILGSDFNGKEVKGQ